MNPLDYDDACSYINTILESDLDGPAQMRWITTIAQKFLADDS